MMIRHVVFSLLICTGVAVSATPISYKLDPAHTFPSFEADHMGISVWRGKLNKSAGSVVVDKAAATGAVEVVVDVASIDFGHRHLNQWAVGKDFFNAKKFPKATYKGKLDGFKDGAPTRVIGDLSLHGVTKPLELKINSYKCIQHPMLKREYCGADVQGIFKRDEFGLDAGKDYGFNMDVLLRIQVEAIADK
jgi:polyisoprenoid-binding protein YceI